MESHYDLPFNGIVTNKIINCENSIGKQFCGTKKSETDWLIEFSPTKKNDYSVLFDEGFLVEK